MQISGGSSNAFFDIVYWIMDPLCAYVCHTVAIWTFTFHKISGFERVILKVNFNPIYRQKLSIFLSENSDLFYSFFFYFLQNLSNPLLFTHCCCYSKELTCLNCDLMQIICVSILLLSIHTHN